MTARNEVRPDAVPLRVFVFDGSRDRNLAGNGRNPAPNHGVL